MTPRNPVPCPQCSAPVEPGLPACPRCHLRLVGPDAARLWQVTQQIDVLRAEADHLVGRLRQPAPQPVGGPAARPYGAPTPAPPLSATQPRPPYGAPPQPMPPMPPYAARRRSGPSGQQVLLGLGALLTLSAASLFLVVFWLVVGVAGQALIMVSLTAAAVGASAWSTLRRLPAAAETFAAVAAGLLLIDLEAAHRLDLGGLGHLPLDGYWAFAGLLGGCVLLLADRAVPRVRDGLPLRPVLTFRPAAATLLSWAGLAAASAAGDGLARSAAHLGLLVLALVGVAVALRCDRPVPDLAVPPAVVPGGVVRGRPGVPLPARRGTRPRVLPLSALPVAVTALAALLVHAHAGLVVGLEPTRPPAERYAAAALLLALPVLALVLRAVPRASAAVRAAVGRDLLVDVAVVAALPALAVVLVDAHRLVLVGLAVVVAAGVVAELALRRTDRRPGTAGTVGWVLLPVLVLATWALTEAAAEDGLALLAELGGSPAPWWLPVLPALAWLAASLGAVATTRRAAWTVVAHTAALATVALLVRDAEPQVQVVATLVACVVTAALAGVPGVLPAGPEREQHELVAHLFAAGYGVAAIAVSAPESAVLNAAALVVTGVCLLAVSAARGRLVGAYPGTFLVSAGVWRLLVDAEVEPVEAYTAVPFVLLVGVGLLQSRREPASPTALTMGPALGVALLPSSWVAIADGDVLRLVVVSLLAVAALVAGVARRWRAPVVVGAVVLVLVALTQGGPLLVHVHAFVTLFLLGALLLGIGVAWERAVLAGRRAAGWFSTLR
ncbi:SCO7613 C-terminal domain-containing membrane protein [Nocardioides solisilvae]|uniref:SCO7613 C-terminal domain-containing membrane protein n=1 Tax=Nocardioides solisilvae TaxID=1542435 RepID=UPI000D7435AF|nr:hypothetical protein [Nocardioides solisilvae]